MKIYSFGFGCSLVYHENINNVCAHNTVCIWFIFDYTFVKHKTGIDSTKTIVFSLFFFFFFSFGL